MHIWANYKDHGLYLGNHPQKAQHFRLVNYNLPRCFISWKTLLTMDELEILPFFWVWAIIFIICPGMYTLYYKLGLAHCR